MAWIAASLLYAVYLKTPEAINSLEMGLAPEVAPGPLAYNALGWFGVFSVILAGWTTANPTIYRSGLAFQALIPKISIKKATISAGLISTIAGIFPAFAMKLLDFVSIYGFILAPFGAIIVFEFFFFKRFRLLKNYSEKNSISFNYAVFFAWFISFIFFYSISIFYEIFLSFLILPAWLFCGILFILFSKFYQKND
jgi:purine-cytosine permease-like protein